MRIILFFLFIAFVSCKKDDSSIPSGFISFTDNFDNDTQGWTSIFSDYPVGAESNYELNAGYAKLPTPLNTNDGALRITGINHSDDLFMGWKKRISGLLPNKSYRATFNFQIASNAPTGAVGVGGAPGESVFLGISITNTEPINQTTSLNYYALNIQKGNQSVSGADRTVIGNIANGTSQEIYVLLNKSGTFNFTTDSNGAVWVMVSTDSGFEARTTLYYNFINVEFSPL